MKPTRIITLSVLLGCTLIALLIAIFIPFRTNLANLDFSISDHNGNLQFEVGENLYFKVNDVDAFTNRELLWEFGDGGQNRISAEETLGDGGPNTEYRFETQGRYLITLTVDNKFEVPKYIDVVSTQTQNALDSIPKIYGVNEGFVDEQLVFSAHSPGATNYEWSFGESGTIDANERQVIYTYKNPGTYRVTLRTNKSKYPVTHIIEVSPLFSIIEEQDCAKKAAEDIKKHFQAIADAKVWDQATVKLNLRHIENTYHKECELSDRHDIVVIINGKKYNDLYSYSQGLHYLEGKGSSTIDINEVRVETAVDSANMKLCNCVKRIEVMQSTITNE